MSPSSAFLLSALTLVVLTVSTVSTGVFADIVSLAMAEVIAVPCGFRPPDVKEGLEIAIVALVAESAAVVGGTTSAGVVVPEVPTPLKAPLVLIGDADRFFFASPFGLLCERRCLRPPVPSSSESDKDVSCTLFLSQSRTER